MKKVKLTVPWGHRNKSTVYYNFFFSNNILQHSFLLTYRQIDTTLLRNFRIYRSRQRNIQKWITKSKQYSTTLHVRVSDYFTYSIIICRYLFITLRYVTLRTSQNLTICILYIYIYIYILHGRYYGVHLTPSGNKNKKRKDTQTSECVWHR
jgi:hypothetical protein